MELANARLKFDYDLADRIVQIAYPSERLVAYDRDSKGRVLAIRTKATAATSTWTNVATNMAYEPFASLKQATLGNGLSMTANWGNDPGSKSGAGGRLASRRLYKTAGGKNPNLSLLTYTYDNDDNITAITDGVNAANSVTYAYDVRGRLAMVEHQRSGQVIYNRTDYRHDANGNRTALERRYTKGQVEPDTTDSYALTPGTNRLASITTASLTRNLIYDNRGNLSTETRGPAVTATTAYDEQLGQ